MMRDHKRPYEGRKATVAKSHKKIIIYVEGRNTEYSYCELLKRQNCSLIPVVKRGHGIGSCVEFVEESNKKYNSLSSTEKAKYQQKWLMYDCDGHDDFCDSIALAKQCGFRVVFSNMCIEYWFVLHFNSHDGSSIPMKANSHSQAHIDMINGFIRQYNRKTDFPLKEYNGSTKKVEEDFFELMLAKDPINNQRRILNAYSRAKEIHLKKKRNGAEFKESVTTMYEFLREIGVVQECKDGTLSLSE